ncbi:hypothetical protein [Streptomyces sp. NPDC056468]|uniref:hypothetical protein n=1 Tax=Streptomyces sp. NPDC056468 TaxID=3345830 RepID=UPI0036AC2DC3
MRDDYLQLPIDADEGFPQSFRLALGDRVYRIEAYVTVVDDALLDSPDPLELPQGGAFLVIGVQRDGVGGAVPLLRRKVMPGLEYEAGELALVFTSVRVHPRNLNGAGAHGSRIVGGVAPRWVS